MDIAIEAGADSVWAQPKGPFSKRAAREAATAATAADPTHTPTRDGRRGDHLADDEPTNIRTH